MKKTTVCNVANLVIVAILWCLFVVAPRLFFGVHLPLWANIFLVPIDLVIAGYIVQYLISPIVNRWIMGNPA
jgi:hypothetical protein